MGLLDTFDASCSLVVDGERFFPTGRRYCSSERRPEGGLLVSQVGGIQSSALEPEPYIIPRGFSRVNLLLHHGNL